MASFHYEWSRPASDVRLDAVPSCEEGDIDKAKLRRILEDMDLMGPWQAFGCVLVEKLGMPAEAFPFYDGRKGSKVHKIVRRILE